MADTAMVSTESLYRTTKCGCESHAPEDNQGACQHCKAGEDEYCRPGCPVQELCERGYYGQMDDGPEAHRG